MMSKLIISIMTVIIELGTTFIVNTNNKMVPCSAWTYWYES